MGRIVEFSSRTLSAIAAEAAGTPDREVCGLLFGAPARVTGHISCRNVAAMPATRFEIDPGALIAAYRAERTGGPRLIGCYHSHPSGDPVPSPRDAADAATDGWLWLIVGRAEIRGWRVVAGGAWHERFDPVDLASIAPA
ncbi:MAG: M67 family metallopeptidase [Sphingomonadales bacterium]|nr:M67 family metallopeptidase [Sphingomonadales bacterium]